MFAARKARRTRYYLTDGFLRTWLAALANTVAAVSFCPVVQLVAGAGRRLRAVEGKAFEKLAGVLYEQRSRKGIGDFPPQRADLRLLGSKRSGDRPGGLERNGQGDPAGSCKRSAAELVRDLPVFHVHVQRFLGEFPSHAGWRVERVSLAPQVPQDVRQGIERQGSLVQDLNELMAGL